MKRYIVYLRNTKLALVPGCPGTKGVDKKRVPSNDPVFGGP